MRSEDDGGAAPAWGFASVVARFNVATAREAYERQAAAAEFVVNSLATSASRISGDLRAARNRDGLRDLALKMLVAIDTNVRAGFDCAESLAQTADVRSFAEVQARFVKEQSERSVRQVGELQLVAFDLLQRAAFARPA